VNREALIALGREAAAWAKAFVELKEALLREGVPDQEAREEARAAAVMTAFAPVSEEEPCPLCRR